MSGLFLFVFDDGENCVGVEAESLEDARELAGGGASLVYTRQLVVSQGSANIAFTVSAHEPT